jgi:hypothetical protein
MSGIFFGGCSQTLEPWVDMGEADCDNISPALDLTHPPERRAMNQPLDYYRATIGEHFPTLHITTLGYLSAKNPSSPSNGR